MALLTTKPVFRCQYYISLSRLDLKDSFSPASICVLLSMFHCNSNYFVSI